MPQSNILPGDAEQAGQGESADAGDGERFRTRPMDRGGDGPVWRIVPETPASQRTSRNLGPSRWSKEGGRGAERAKECLLQLLERKRERGLADVCLVVEVGGEGRRDSSRGHEGERAGDNDGEEGTAVVHDGYVIWFFSS